MNKCYYYKIINNNKGIFNNIVDAVGILTMENSNREHQYMNQINKHNIHSNIHIQYNKGYINCNKELKKQNTLNDICDSYYTLFKYFINNNYDKVLILEDDFLLDDNINNYINDIEDFTNNNKFDAINLGAGMFILNPLYINDKFKQCFMFMTTHGIIYNRSYLLKYINMYENGEITNDYDKYFIFPKKLYIYEKPLVYQPIVKTTNSSNWEIMGIKTQNILFLIYKLLNMKYDNYENIKKAWIKTYKLYYLINILLISLIIKFIINNIFNVSIQILKFNEILLMVLPIYEKIIKIE